MFEAARTIVSNHGFMSIDDIRDPNITFVVMKQRLTLQRKLHEMGLKNATKLQFDLEVAHVGKTSITFQNTLKDGDTGEILGENPMKMVQVNKTTRQSVEYPEFYRQTLASNITYLKDITMTREVPPDRKPSAFRYVVQVSLSETDINRHVNQSSYVKFCMDCAAKASLSGFYLHFDRDMCLYPSLDWVMTYVGESVADDILEIFTWQDEKTVTKIYFCIELKSKPIFHAVAVFDKLADTYAYFISKI